MEQQSALANGHQDGRPSCLLNLRTMHGLPKNAAGVEPAAFANDDRSGRFSFHAFHIGLGELQHANRLRQFADTEGIRVLPFALAVLE